MKIIIVGAGFTGIQLAKRLIAERNDVVLIDKDSDTVAQVANRLDCMVLPANGNSIKTLEQAGIAHADALVAVTSSDELNMITCSLVESMYPDVITIARVRNYDYYIDANESDGEPRDSRHLYGINFMVHPDVEAIEAIVNAVEHGAVTEAVDFEGSKFELANITIEKNSTLDGLTVQEIRKHTDKSFVVAFVEKEGVAMLPSGPTLLHAGDRIGFLADRDDLQSFVELCGSELRVFHKIAILGAGRIGTGVAEKLIKPAKKGILSRISTLKKKINQQIVIIDPDDKLTQAAAARFPEAHVYRGEITDDSLIEDEGIAAFDLVIAATHNHEKNMIASAYLESIGVKSTVCLITNSSYSAIARNIGIDVSIPLRDTVVDSILSHLRGRNVSGIHTISEDGLEIIEVTLPEDTKLEGKALKDIAEAGVFLVLLISRNEDESYVIPGGNTVLHAGDKLAVIHDTKDTQHITEKFGVQN
ncbi:MAG: Trk system potassium transport protein TrkA [Treponema sp.]|nr:Trk system potassium transport protein TrkA [Candidatus Treponema caballi]